VDSLMYTLSLMSVSEVLFIGERDHTVR
jgi:hypothetical protein